MLSKNYILNYAYFNIYKIININTTTEEDSIYPLYNVTSGVQTISGVMLNDVRPK